MSPPPRKPAVKITEKDIQKMAEEAAKKHGEPGVPPWLPPCGDHKYENCYDCPYFEIDKIPPECRKHYDLTGYFTVVGQKFTMDENGKVVPIDN